MGFYEDNKEVIKIVWGQFMVIKKAIIKNEDEHIINEQWKKFYQLLEDDQYRNIFQQLYPIDRFITTEFDRVECSTPIDSQIDYDDVVKTICN